MVVFKNTNVLDYLQSISSKPNRNRKCGKQQLETRIAQNSVPVNLMCFVQPVVGCVSVSTVDLVCQDQLVIWCVLFNWLSSVFGQISSGQLDPGHNKIGSTFPSILESKSIIWWTSMILINNITSINIVQKHWYLNQFVDLATAICRRVLFFSKIINVTKLQFLT